LKTISNLIDLTNRVALISGAAGHVGSCAAKTMVELGAKVILLDVNSESCNELSGEINKINPGHAVSVICDLANETELRSSIQQALRESEKLDIFIHTAALVGTSELKGWAVPFEKQTVDAWNTLLTASR